MLVLLRVKGRLSTALPREVGGWWSLRSRMRQPVVAGDPARLEMRPQGDGFAFSLVAPGGRKLLTGSLGRLAEAPSVSDPGNRYRLSAEAVAARARELDEAFPWPGDVWVGATPPAWGPRRWRPGRGR